MNGAPGIWRARVRGVRSSVRSVPEAPSFMGLKNQTGGGV